MQIREQKDIEIEKEGKVVVEIEEQKKVEVVENGEQKVVEVDIEVEIGEQKKVEEIKEHSLVRNENIFSLLIGVFTVGSCNKIFNFH